MKLQFKVQQYQTDAVDAVVEVFTGQPKHDGVSYRIDPGRQKPTAAPALFETSTTPDSGLRNAEIALTPKQLLDNVHLVQRSRNLPLSNELKDSKAAPGAPNLDIEMETGTGKTYVYIKTIMELNKRYGWSKFIVVVPSVAIREGVKKSFDVTAEHFQQTYGTKPRSFIYNSSQLHELERFSSDAGVQVMIINIQAFNATGKDQRRIYDVLDDFQSRRPIDVIKREPADRHHRRAAEDRCRQVPGGAGRVQRPHGAALLGHPQGRAHQGPPPRRTRCLQPEAGQEDRRPRHHREGPRRARQRTCISTRSRSPRAPSRALGSRSRCRQRAARSSGRSSASTSAPTCTTSPAASRPTRACSSPTSTPTAT